MSRRLLDLCLLAYPRARRERDRAYLRVGTPESDGERIHEVEHFASGEGGP